MAISWLTVIKMVPWTDVIANAPKVAEGARKLWGSVARKDASTTIVARKTAASGGPVDTAALQAQVASLEAAVAELHEQMRTSSELIKALAEQNTQLVARIEANRRRMLWVAAISVVALVLAVVFSLSARVA